MESAAAAEVETAGPGPLVLSGRVVHGDGMPFSGSVALDEFGALAWTDADGRFRLRGVAAGPLTLTLAARDGSYRGVHVVMPIDGEFLLRLPDRERVVEGVVLRATDDAPIPGAHVEVRNPFRRQDDPGPAFHGATDEAGRFRLSIAGMAGERLFVEAPGCAPGEAMLPPEGVTAVIRLLEGGVVSGRLLAPGGKPISGGVASAKPAEPYARKDLLRRAVADAAGRFRIEGLPPGRYLLAASAPGFVLPAAYREAARSIEVRPGTATEVELTLEPAAALVIRAMLPDGSPAAGARITLFHTFDSPHLTGPDLETGPDGTVRLEGVAAGRNWQARARLPGYAAAYASIDLPPEPAGNEELILQFALPVFLDVSVVDAENGRPIPGEIVNAGRQSRSIAGEDGRARLGPFDRLPRSVAADHPEYLPIRFEPEAGAASPIILALTPGESVSGVVLRPDGTPATGGTVAKEWPIGPDGRFRVGGLAAGRVVLHAEAAGLEGAAEATTGESGVVIPLEAAPHEPPVPKDRVRVELLDQDGRPIGSWRGRISMSSTRGYAAGPAGGNVAALVVEIAPGQTYSVDVLEAWTADGQRLAGTTVGPLQDGDADRAVRLPAERLLGGVVLGPDERPVAGARVVVGGGDGDAQTWTDLEGRFRLSGLGAETTALGVEAPPDRGFAPLALKDVRTGRDDLVLRLAADPRPAIRVIGPAGEPLAGAMVEVDGDGADFMEETGPDGRVEITGLSPDGVYRLRVQAPSVEPPVTPHDRTFEAWSPADLVVRFEAAGTISGRVVDPNGAPLERILVRLLDGDEVIQGEQTATDGTFRFGGLPLRRFAIEAVRPGVEPPPEARRTVEPNGESVEIVLDPGPVLDVVVEDWPEGLRGAPYQLTALAGERGSRTGYSGRSMRHYVAAGERYALWMRVGDRIVFETNLQASSAPVVVRTIPAGRITVRLSGPPLARNVLLYGPGLRLHATDSGGGLFLLTGVPPGEWTIIGSAFDGREVRRTETTARAGDEVSLRIE